MKLKNLSTINFFLAWVFGFFALLSFDLFMEGIIFEKLDWNGTTKNDWFKNVNTFNPVTITFMGWKAIMDDIKQSKSL